MKRPVSSLSHVTLGERLQFDQEAFFLGKALNDLLRIPNLNHSTPPFNIGIQNTSFYEILQGAINLLSLAVWLLFNYNSLLLMPS
jgi:hypothetical protein